MSYKLTELNDVNVVNEEREEKRLDHMVMRASLGLYASTVHTNIF